MKNIDAIINRIEVLKPISPVVNRLMEIVGNPGSSTRDLVELVECDSALTANLLRLCNSTYYGLTVHVNSVHHALTLLGMNRLVELILLRSTGENLLRAQKGYGLKPGELWKHSVASARLARSFAEKNNRGFDVFLIYTACLLKDIGKVVIEENVGRSLAKIRHLVRKKEYSFDQAEEAVLGIDHARLGGLIAERWHFSPKMAFLIRNHHLTDPSTRSDVESGIIYLADTVSRMVLAGIGADNLAYKVYEEIFLNLNVSAPDLVDLTSAFQVHLHLADRLLHSMQS